MGRVGVPVVRVVGDLRVGELVVVGGGDVNQAGRARSLDELPHRRRGLLGSRNVELALGEHEVVLRVDVPQDSCAHLQTPSNDRPGSSLADDVEAPLEEQVEVAHVVVLLRSVRIRLEVGGRTGAGVPDRAVDQSARDTDY